MPEMKMAQAKYAEYQSGMNFSNAEGFSLVFDFHKDSNCGVIWGAILKLASAIKAFYLIRKGNLLDDGAIAFSPGSIVRKMAFESNQSMIMDSANRKAHGA